jgi:predicted nucleic acid-binding protein
MTGNCILVRYRWGKFVHGARRRELEQWIEQTLRPWFAWRILPVTDIVAERWGSLTAEQRLNTVLSS